jgi:hypothetical protein
MRSMFPLLELCCCGLFYFPFGLFEPDFRLLPQDFLLTLENFFPLAIGSTLLLLLANIINNSA